MNELNLTRRDFIKIASLAGGGFALGFYLPTKETAVAADMPNGFAPNAWLRIDSDGATTITIARSELGQGVRTSLAMIVADELEADWSTVRVEQAIADDKYGDMTTGGSTSVRNSWEKLRKAGATTREMLITAAANSWQVDRASCRAENGTVVHAPSSRRIAYGELAQVAANLPVPEDAPLKSPQDFRYIGRSLPRLDTEVKVKGTAVFGLDVKIPGMLVAVVERCPVWGGILKSHDATKALAIKGVRHVVPIGDSVAVVAESTWAAMKGREALNVTWDKGPNAELNSDGIHKMFEEYSKREALVVRNEGDTAGALAKAAKRIEAVYEVPFLSHSPMEPMNCVADVRPDRAEIWAPTQAPQWARGAVAGAIAMPPEKVIVHVPLVGGAFGRRIWPDFAIEAALISKAIGAPVKVVWSREDDMRHDLYRPASYHQLAAGIDEQGRLIAFSHRIVAPSISAQLFPQQDQGKSPDAVDGAANLPYLIPNLLVDYVMANTPVPIMWWRSVYNSQNPFASESFLDEVAAAIGVDPLKLRLDLLPPDSRLRSAVELLAKKAPWPYKSDSGKKCGVACHTSFGSSFAEMAEVSVDANGKLRVHKIVAAVNCGPFVHPDTIQSQVEGAVALALSAALKGEITVAYGAAVQSNFDDYPILTFDEMPEVEVHIVPSTEALGGIGEPGLPPVAPAVCNAIFAATGKRVRRLPIRTSELRGT